MQPRDSRLRGNDRSVRSVAVPDYSHVGSRTRTTARTSAAFMKGMEEGRRCQGADREFLLPLRERECCHSKKLGDCFVTSFLAMSKTMRGVPRATGSDFQATGAQTGSGGNKHGGGAERWFGAGWSTENCRCVSLAELASLVLSRVPSEICAGRLCRGRERRSPSKSERERGTALSDKTRLKHSELCWSPHYSRSRKPLMSLMFPVRSSWNSISTLAPTLILESSSVKR